MPGPRRGHPHPVRPTIMNTARQHWPLLLAAAFALGGCVAVPVYDDDYGYRSYGGHGYYTEETIILSPPPRVEYRGYAPGHLWIDGYWSRTGTRQHWVPGYWAAPGGHVPPRAYRAPPRHPAEQGHEPRRRGNDFDEPRRRQDRAREPAHDRRSAIAPGSGRQALEPPRSARDAERRAPPRPAERTGRRAGSHGDSAAHRTQDDPPTRQRGGENDGRDAAGADRTQPPGQQEFPRRRQND